MLDLDDYGDDQGDADDVHAVDHDAFLAEIDLGHDGDDDGGSNEGRRIRAPPPVPEGHEFVNGFDLANAPPDGANAVAARTTAPAVLGKRLLRERKAASAVATAAHAAGFALAVARRDAAWERERAVRPAGWRPVHAPGLPEPIQGTSARGSLQVSWSCA